jgi:hypothetical protein
MLIAIRLEINVSRSTATSTFGLCTGDDIPYRGVTRARFVD